MNRKKRVWVMDFLNELWADIQQKGLEHNVNPLIFAILYVGSIPPYMASMVWVVKNHRRGKEIVIPVISTLFFFILPALYIVIFGRNVAWWVYGIIAVMLIYGGYSGYRKFRSEIDEEVNPG